MSPKQCNIVMSYTWKPINLVIYGHMMGRNIILLTSLHIVFGLGFFSSPAWNRVCACHILHSSSLVLVIDQHGGGSAGVRVTGDSQRISSSELNCPPTQLLWFILYQTVESWPHSVMLNSDKLTTKPSLFSRRLLRSSPVVLEPPQGRGQPLGVTERLADCHGQCRLPILSGY